MAVKACDIIIQILITRPIAPDDLAVPFIELHTLIRLNCISHRVVGSIFGIKRIHPEVDNSFGSLRGFFPFFRIGGLGEKIVAPTVLQHILIQVASIEQRTCGIEKDAGFGCHGRSLG